jgi:hypothetical protein
MVSRAKAGWSSICLGCAGADAEGDAGEKPAALEFDRKGREGNVGQIFVYDRKHFHENLAI